MLKQRALPLFFRIHPRVFAYLSLCLALTTACANEPAVAVSSATQGGIFWKISKAGIAPSYLLGTIHSEDPRVLDTFNLFKERFEASRVLSLEVPLDKAASKKATAGMFLADGRNLQELIGVPRFNQVVDVMVTHGYPLEIVMQMKPWAVFATLNMPEVNTGLFLDAVLFHKAEQEKKKFIPLETIEEQTALFDQLPLETQIQLLDETLANLDDIEADLTKAINTYLSRDLAKIEALQGEFLERTPANLRDFYVYELITKRNRRMFIRMQPILTYGNVFFAVGALHLPGETGLIQLLRHAGYQLTPIF